MRSLYQTAGWKAMSYRSSSFAQISRVRPATNLTECDTWKAPAGILCWLMDPSANWVQAGRSSAWSSETAVNDTCLVNILHHWYHVVDAGQSVRTVFIDFTIALDHVDHNILIAKMLEFDDSPTKRRRRWDIPKLVEIRRNRRCFTTSYGRLYNVLKYMLICRRRMDLL